MKSFIKKWIWIMWVAFAILFLFASYRLAEAMGSQTYFMPGFLAGVTAFAGLNLLLVTGVQLVKRIILMRKRRVYTPTIEEAMNRCRDCHGLRKRAGGVFCDVYNGLITSILECGEWEGGRGDINNPEWRAK